MPCSVPYIGFKKCNQLRKLVRLVPAWVSLSLSYPYPAFRDTPEHVLGVIR